MAYGSADSSYGAGASVFHLDASHADTVSVPDADLLFNGAFKRHGPDLVLTGHDGERHVVPGYFSAGHHPALVAPNGARLSAALVDLLAGSPAPGQYAQAASTAPASPIGKVEKIVGHVVVFRNGIEVALNVGDAVYKGDVIQTGVNSACGVDFPDGTALNLVANTRMALSEFSFDPNGHSNDALFSLVQGTFAFVAGKVAHTGDMKIETPVATMGIRGTTGFVQEQVATISANAGNVTYSFAVVEDYATSRVGSYELIDNNPSSPTYGQVIATVSQNGFLTFITPQGANLPPIVTTQPMTNSQLGFEQQIIDDLFAILNSGTAPQSTPRPPGSSTPPDDMPRFLQLLQNDIGNTYTFNVANGGYGQTPVTATINGGGTPPNNLGPGPQNTSNIFIWTAGNGTWTTPTWSQPGVPNTAADAVEILSGPLTYDANYTIGSLYVAPGVTFDITGGSLTVLGLTDDQGTILVTGDPPALKIEGPLTVGIAGHLHVSGAGDIVDIANSADNLGVIAATDHGKIVFKQSNLTNERTGKVKADDHGRIVFKGGGVDNAGIIEAKDHGSITFKSIGNGFSGNPIDVTNSITDSNNVTTGGTIKATDGGTIKFLGDEDAGSVNNNYGVMEATRHGTLVFDDIAVANSTGGTIEARDGGTVIIKGGDPTAPALTDGGGTIAVIGRGSMVDIVDHATINGYVEVGSNFVQESGVVGTLEADGGTLFVSCDSNLFGPINVDISNGGLAHFGDVINQNAAVTVAFCGPGTLQLDQAPNTGLSATPVTVSDFWLGDTLDLTNLRYSTRETVTYTDGVLTVVDGCSSESFTLTCGDYSSGDFVLVEDATGGTEVVLADFAVRSGDWDTVCTWSNGVPNADDTAVIDAHVTVCVDEREGIENLIVGACAALDIGDCGSMIVANALDDSGRIEVGGSHSFGDSELKIGGPVKVTHTGEIVADGRHASVKFSDDTVDNSGRLEAKDHGRVKFDHTFVTNDGGTIAAIGAGAAVDLFDATVHGGALETRWGGIIETPTGATFAGVTLAGGDFETNDGTSLNLECTTTIEGTVTFKGGGTFTLADGANIVDACWGILDNSSTIMVAAGGTTSIDVDDLTNESNGTIESAGAGSTLTLDVTPNATNEGTIEASSGGTLNIELHSTSSSGGGNYNLIEALAGGTVAIEGGIPNYATGIIEADGSGTVVKFSANANGNTVENAGTIEAVAHGTVNFQHPAGQPTLTIDNNGGTIEAIGNGATIALHDVMVDNTDCGNNDGIIKATGTSTVELFNGTDIIGGTISADGNGVVEITAGHTGANVTFDGSAMPLTINGAGNVQVDDDTSLTLQGTIDNHDTIDLGDGSGVATLTIDGTVNLDDQGAVNLISGDEIVGGSSGGTLDNHNSISGSGTIGGDDLTLTNEANGTIDAIGTLTVDTGNTFTNHGTLEVSSGTTLTIDDGVNGNGGAVIENGTLVFNAKADTDVSFDDVGGATPGDLVLAAPAHFTGTISNFSGTDLIDLSNQHFLSNDKAVWTQTNTTDGGTGTLQIETHTGAILDTLHLTGIYTSANFALQSDSASGTDVTWTGPAVETINGINTEIGFGSSATITFDTTGPFSNHWVVTQDATNHELAPSVQSVVLGSTTYMLADHAGDGFQTIQEAVNAAQSGDSVLVAPGTYAENLVINTPIQLLGANAGIDPNTGTDGAASIITAGASDLDTSLISVMANNVTIAGFTLDGDNTLINTAGGNISEPNGGVTNPDVGQAIANWIDASLFTGDPSTDGANFPSLSGLNVTNNIITNVAYSGVELYNGNPGNVSSGNTIAGNLFENLDGDGGNRSAVLLDGNAYASITGNVMANVSNGVITDSFYLADPASVGTVISDNTINTDVLGISTNLVYSAASPFTVSGNTITQESEPGLTAQSIVGIDVLSFLDSSQVSLTNNSVAGAQDGIYVWDSPTTNGVTVSGGTLNDDLYSIFVTDNDSLFGFGSGDQSTVNVSGSAINSTQEENGAALLFGTTVTDTGDVAIAGGGLAEFEGAFDQNVTFTGFGILELGQSQNYHATISGYSDAAVLDLSDVNFTTGTPSATYNSGDLTVTNGSQTAVIAIAGTEGTDFNSQWYAYNDGHGGTLVVDPDLVVTNGGSQTLSTASTDMIAFSGGTGSLDFTTLASATGFTGEIAGFTGTAPDAAHSDIVDLTGINYDSGSFSDTYNSVTGVLTVSDGTNSASLTFVDFNGTFKFASNGSGGTDIFDPPATNSSSPSASFGKDSFVFHTGTNGGNTGTLWDAGTRDHADWAHTHQEWSQLAGDMNGVVAAEIAQHAESHLHYALHGAEHLH